jgi:flagellar FliJ protein
MKPKPWKMLKDVARVKQDASAVRVARLVTQHGEMETKLKLLLDYRDDYRGRLARAQAEGIHGERLRNYQQFLANLQVAIEQQADVLKAMQKQLSAARASLAGERRTVQSYGVLDQRAQTIARTTEQKHQQALQDEFANLNFLKRIAGGDD